MLARNVQREIERDLNLQSQAAMANSDAGTSSGSAGGGKYQVFLSFCGRDTRDGFTSFLYEGLRKNGIHAFMDDEEIRVGEKIGDEILQAIDGSQIYVPIFSEKYASRKWCLLELVRMVDNISKSKEKKIRPIFFYVEPDDLKTESYRKAIGDLKEKFSHELESWKLESWEEAPTKVVESKAWVLRKGESQAIFVDKVVEELLQELKIKYKSVTEYPVGLNDRVAEVLKLLDVNCSDEARLLGIHGMGGISKTTLARLVYNELLSRFGNCCAFFDDVQKYCNRKGLVKLQKKLLEEIGSMNVAKIIRGVDHGRKSIERTFHSNKFLIVLDNVGEENQIKNLIGHGQLYSGTRIIITTRDIGVMETIKKMKSKNSNLALQIRDYEMVALKFSQALQLFKRHAFLEGSPTRDFDDLSIDIVHTTGCLPLALEVIGSSLFGEPQNKWEITLKQLKKIPNEQVQETLRISFNALNDHERDIFLDIACFLINEDITNANYMWEACEFYIDIEVLVRKSLIKITDNKFWMHDQLRDLGREIVRQENPKNLGKQSRVYINEESIDFVRTKEMKEDVEALDLWRWNSDFSISHEEIGRFISLRFLRLFNVTLHGDFIVSLPNLRWISWDNEFSSSNLSVPSMHAKNLVVFELFHNNFTNYSKVWDLIKMATKLKKLTLVNCCGITRTPDLSKCLDLERLTFDRCESLKEIDDSIGKLKCLLDLNIINCGLIERVPDEIRRLVKLECFSLIGCSKVSRLPTSIDDLASLRELDLSYTGITTLPESIEKLRCLSNLCLKGIEIRQFPNSIGKLTSLCTLNLSNDAIHINIDRWELPEAIGMLDKLEELYLGRRNELFGKIPDEIGDLSSLRVLELCETRICQVPGTIDRLSHLSTLYLTNCDEITELPELPASLVNLHVTSSSLQVVPNLSMLTNLVDLVLSDGSKDKDSSNLKHTCDLGWISRLSKLKKLELCLLNIAAPPTELGLLSLLQDLSLSGLDLQPLEQLPPSLFFLELDNFSSTRPLQSNLKMLMLHLSRLQEIQFYGFSQLQHLCLLDCDLQILSIPSSVRTLTVCKCDYIIEIQFLGLSASLEKLVIDDCSSIERMVLYGDGGSLGVLDQPESSSSSSESTYSLPGVLLLPNALKKLKELELLDCVNLLDIQVIGTLLSLQDISIEQCNAMEKLTGISNLKNLSRLNISDCSKLRVVEGLDKLEFLIELQVNKCPSLETLFDISNSKISDECKICIKQCKESLDCRELLISSYFCPFKRYKEMMVQQGAPRSETNKAKMEGDAEEPNTELQLQFHPFASSQYHEPSRFGHLKSLNLGGHTTFERYKRMAQEGAPQSETNKAEAKMEGDAKEPNTELWLGVHPSASSQHHEISEEVQSTECKKFKAKAKMEGDAKEPNTELRLGVHPSASSQHHEISEEPPMDNVNKRRCLEREIR